MSRYIETIKVKDRNKDKNNKFISFRIDDKKVLEKYKVIWTEMGHLKNIILNDFLVYDDRYIKTKIRMFGDKVCTNFRDLSVPEDDIECKTFIVISIDSLLVCEHKYYLQVYLDSCSYEIVDKRPIDYFGKNPFKTDEN